MQVFKPNVDKKLENVRSLGWWQKASMFFSIFLICYHQFKLQWVSCVYVNLIKVVSLCHSNILERFVVFKLTAKSRQSIIEELGAVHLLRDAHVNWLLADVVEFVKPGQQDIEPRILGDDELDSGIRVPDFDSSTTSM